MEKPFNTEGLGFSDEELFSFDGQEREEIKRDASEAYSYWRAVRHAFFRKKSNVIMLTLLALLLLFTFLYPSVIRYDARWDPYLNINDAEAKHLSPLEAMRKFGVGLSWSLGSGASGQSTFDALWYGARISLSLALIAAAINLTLGVLLGALWGFSKRLDPVMTEVYNVVSNIPYILLVSVIVTFLSASFWSMIFALTVTGWLSIAYFVRTQVLIIRDREYNLASRCLGTPLLRMAMKNVLPFMTSVVVTLAATEIPSYLSYEVFLAYIGMGLKETSLGRLIGAASPFMLIRGWSLEFWAPVALASVIAVVLYVVGQNLADASDPRTHI